VSALIRVTVRAEGTEHELRPGVYAADELEGVADVDLRTGDLTWFSIRRHPVCADGFFGEPVELSGDERLAAGEQLEDEAFRVAKSAFEAERKSGTFEVVKPRERYLSARRRRLGRAS
jgi:hypothetical protein